MSNIYYMRFNYEINPDFVAKIIPFVSYLY